MLEADCGILFVHGIGEQRRADTLIQATDPLVRWLEGWLSRPAGPSPLGAVRVTGARVSARADQDDAPAHACLELTLNGAAGAGSRQTWLVAEAHWAEEVRMPPFSRLAAWMLTTGAWILLSHAVRSATAQKGSRWRYLKVAQAIGLALIVTPPMELAIASLAVLGALPIPRLRVLLSDLLLRASGVLGDSYVLVESTVQREAVVASTRRNLAWLARRCRKVAVVAHSQGAAVAHRALRHPEPVNVSVFITYGSGLAKLEEIEVMSQGHRATLTMAKYGFPLTVIGAAVALRIWSQYGTDPWAGRALWWCAMPLLAAFGVMLMAFEDRAGLAGRIRALSLRGVRSTLDWLDLYASADPVPNGPLVRHDAPVEGVESRRVSNLRSIVGDHTAYWQNEAEFIPAVLQRLDAHFKTGLFADAGAELAGAARAHERRVRWLFVARWTGFASLLLLAWALRSRLAGWGQAFFDLLQVPLLSFIGSFITEPVTAAVQLAARLTGRDAAAFDSSVRSAFGVAIIAAVLAVWHRVFRAAWRAWEKEHVRRLFGPRDPANATLAAVASLVTAAVPAAVAVTSAVWPGALSLRVTELMIYQALGGLLVTLYWFFAALLLRAAAAQYRTEHRVPWAVVGSTGLVLAFAIGFTPRLLPDSLWDLVGPIVVVGVWIGLIAKWQIQLTERARSILARWHRVATGTPLALALAYFIARLVLGDVVEKSPSGERVSDALVGAAGVYVIVLFAARGALRLVERRVARARSASPPVEST